MRPRGRAWGNEAQRAVLHAIAEDIATRTAHKVVAIEALRSDGYLEFVAIAGNADAREKMLGAASPLALEHIRSLGHEMAGGATSPASASTTRRAPSSTSSATGPTCRRRACPTGGTPTTSSCGCC